MIKLYFDELLKKPIWCTFLISWIFYLVGLFLFSQFVWDTETYMLSYDGDNFEKFIKGVRKIDLVRYLLSPIWILFLSSAIWLTIKTGSFLAKLKFDNKLLLKISFLGMMVISLSFWVKSVWFILIKGSYSPDEIKIFYPFSLVSLLDIDEFNSKVIKIISQINLYHFGLILFISWLIAIKYVLSYGKSFLLVFISYGLSFSLLQAIKIAILL